MELKGKTILITGGSAGMGLEATKQFLQAGSLVIALSEIPRGVARPSRVIVAVGR